MMYLHCCYLSLKLQLVYKDLLHHLQTDLGLPEVGLFGVKWGVQMDFISL